MSTPDIIISGVINLQKRGIIFKKKQYLEYSLMFSDLKTSLILANLNDRILYNYNPPIILLIILIISILLFARWIIYLKKGYKIKNIIIITMTVITLILVWFLL
jgi:cation transport ATPase